MASTPKSKNTRSTSKQQKKPCLPSPPRDDHKTYVKLQDDDDVSAWYCPICVRSLPFLDFRTKELKIFLSSDTIEHTQKPQKAPKKLNKQTHELMEKFPEISQLNDPNKNTVSCDYKTWLYYISKSLPSVLTSMN